MSLAAGGPGTCTFTNTKHATLTINKTAVGGNGSFAYTTSGGGLGSFSPITTCGGTGGSGALDVPSAKLRVMFVTATSQSGWDLTTIACTGSATVAIGTGQGAGFNQGTSAG